MISYALANFLAQPSPGDKVIRIYDINKKLRYEVNPNIAYFFTKANQSIIRIHNENDIYLNFINALEAATATSKLNDAKKYLTLTIVPYESDELSDSEQRRLAYFHALSKTMNSNTQKIEQSKYKSSHNVRLNEVWSSELLPVATYSDAVTQSIVNSAITLYDQVFLTELPGSSGQTWYYNSVGTFIRPWIDPVDVPFPLTNNHSVGFTAILYRGDDATIGIPGSIISSEDGAFVIEYYAGMFHFAYGYTPQNMGWGHIKATFFQYSGTFANTLFYSVEFNSGTSQLVFNSGDTSEEIIDLSPLSVSSSISISNIDMIALITSGDSALACLTGVTTLPIMDSYISVYINGVQVNVGNGSKNSDCYFSNDGGITAKLWSAIEINDLLYWNSSIAGYSLDSSTDKITFIYLTS
jgi:hypothetical protein